MSRIKVRSRFNVWLGCLLPSLFAFTVFAQTNSDRSLVLVVGAPGEPEYAAEFAESARSFEDAAGKGGLRLFEIGTVSQNATNRALGNEPNDRSLLLNTLSNECARPGGELWVVFVGHGTFDGRTANFNLRGPDISAQDLAAALKPCRRPLAVINCASASGPFLNALSATGRVVITATRSGYEVNATRFGTFFAHAIADPEADLDKDGQTSLLEAFLYASRRVEQFYREAGRLATEHALLDDNGDGLGTPAEWFRGVRAIKTAADGKAADGVRAHQFNLVRNGAERDLSPEARARRDSLEQKLSDLRLKKSTMPEDDYYGRLEPILLELARLYNSSNNTVDPSTR